MSWHRRSFPHQNLIARQGTPNTSLAPGLQPTTSGQNSAPTASNTPPAGGNNGNGGGKGGDKNTTSSSPSTSPTGQPQTSNPATSSDSAQNGSSTTSTGPSSSSTAITSASSTNTLSSTSNVQTTLTPTRVVSTPVVGPSTSIYTYTGIMGSSTTPPASTGTSSNNSNSVGGMSTGALVGVIAGGLFGLICLIALGSYILRWWNKHSAERDFVDDYNAPDTVGESSAHDFPPPMTQHTSSPSLSSGAGIAGQGIFASRAPAMASPGAYHGGYSADEESINGPFSSQPQPQAAYNPESYGQYAPYNSDAGYQEAMRGYQGQRGYEAPVNIGYAVSGPSTPQPAVPASLTPRVTAPKTTAAAAIAAAHAAAASQVSAASASTGQRQSAVYNEEDAYGGF